MLSRRCDIMVKNDSATQYEIIKKNKKKDWTDSETFVIMTFTAMCP